jgi:phospholipid N-methyltransferase
MPNFRSSALPGRIPAPSKGQASGLAVSFQEFLEKPLAVGSAFPASRWLVEATLRPLDWSRIRLVVEYGPGTGCFTRAILDRLDPRGRVVAFETGGHFVRHLRETIDDPRLSVVESPAQMAAAGLSEHGPVDCILSGIPFSTLAPGEDESLMKASCDVLADDGQFVAYQMRRSVLAPLRRNFGRVRHDREWRNIPPCHIYWASEKR